MNESTLIIIFMAITSLTSTLLLICKSIKKCNSPFCSIEKFENPEITPNIGDPNSSQSFLTKLMERLTPRKKEKEIKEENKVEKADIENAILGIPVFETKMMKRAHTFR